MLVLVQTMDDRKNRTTLPIVKVGDTVYVSPWTNSCGEHYALSSLNQVGNPTEWKPAIVLQVFHSYDADAFGNWFARVQLV